MEGMCNYTRVFPLYSDHVPSPLFSAELEMIKSDYWLLMREGGGGGAVAGLFAPALVF